ncbi:hypothetical protein KDA00_03160 [Candidatus Saccharibacteria bacterium]|nr:hypothetical protein [Candidatus Saccharibacteria bacterium]
MTDPMEQEYQLSPEIIQYWEDFTYAAQERAAHLLQSGGNPLYRLISGAVRQPNMEDINDVAYKLHRKLEIDVTSGSEEDIAEELIANSAVNASAIAYIVDGIKTNEIGSESPAYVSNSLINTANDILALDTIEQLARQGKSADEIVQSGLRLFYASEGLRYHPSPTIGWLFPKLQSFGMALFNASLLVKRYDDSDLLHLAPAEVRQTARENDQLFTATKSLQRYGLKPAVAPAIQRSNTREWLVMDPFAMNRERGGIEHERRLSASFMGNRTQFASSQPNIARVESTTLDGVAYDGVTTEGLITNTDDLSCNISIGIQGELVTCGGSNPLRPFFKRLGMLGEYEQLRSELLSIYFDLVTPVYVQGIIKQELSDIRSSNPNFDGLRTLVLARTRIIKILKDDIEEILEKEHDVPRGYSGGIVRHDVIQHIRALPEGYRASPAARKACLDDLGIVLADEGETYVRPHKRGNLENRGKGHKATYDVGAMATKLGKP